MAQKVKMTTQTMTTTTNTTPMIGMTYPISNGLLSKNTKVTQWSKEKTLDYNTSW